VIFRRINLGVILMSQYPDALVTELQQELTNSIASKISKGAQLREAKQVIEAQEAVIADLKQQVERLLAPQLDVGIT